MSFMYILPSPPPTSTVSLLFYPVLTDAINMTDMKAFYSNWCCWSYQAMCVLVSVSLFVYHYLYKCQHLQVKDISVPIMYISYLHKTARTWKWESSESLHQPRRLSLLINLCCVLIQYRSSWHPSGRELSRPRSLSPGCPCAHLQPPLFTGFNLASFATTGVSTAEDNAHFSYMI